MADSSSITHRSRVPGALLKVFVGAPTLEVAEAAVEAVIAEILDHSEPLADGRSTRARAGRTEKGSVTVGRSASVIEAAGRG
ncbi:hypothetical protein ACFWMG_36645 [Streptomyces sp. NPDC127074]|uniref:hypothetical protein n=1 Tax=Streptomyces sp. NPDC127074 TaxID=3347130 RepID=UPI0036557B2E